MSLSEKDVLHIKTLLSPERLQPLINLTGSETKAIELHQETLRAGAQLFGIIATIEIALRNVVCENLSNHFAVTNWLVQPPVPFQWRKPEAAKATQALDQAKRAAYSKLSQAQKHALDILAYPKGRPANKSHLDRSKDRRKHIAVTDGKVVAELTLFFWKRLYGPEYEQSLWRTTLKKTFPNKKITRPQVAVQLENLYQARNRLAHHEPVLRGRLSEAVKAINFIAENLHHSPVSGTTALSKLVEHDLMQMNLRVAGLHAQLDIYK